MSSDVQVVEKTADRLAVLIPPFHGIAHELFLPAVLLLVLALSLRNAPSFARIAMGGLCLVFVVLAFYLSTSRILVVLSRPQHAFLIERQAFGFEVSRKSYSLDDVAGFGLYSSQSNKGNVTSHDISVQLKSGGEFGVAGVATNQAGYDTAVEALNDFLKE